MQLNINKRDQICEKGSSTHIQITNFKFRHVKAIDLKFFIVKSVINISD